ncbi:hypothetical protein TrCOL_g6729 [Triparma columacea]|uniref:Bacterial surface antigen (D15) domain-containing protein n=1 Tax=Triparma columacea TaxID=722753 RepID=A0A9W7G6B6_9STRA|nr:hypothetical protein TrCOL_g6729 [Triparma columacea]
MEQHLTSPSFVKSILTTTGGYDATQLSDLYESINMFVLTMKETNCYETLSATLLPAEDQKGNPIPGAVSVQIQAREKNWYKLRIGGGIKQFSGSGGTMLPSDSLTVPTVQFETSLNLLNLAGNAESISASYNVDQGGTADFNATHYSPLLSASAPGVSSRLSARYEEVDHSLLRSYTEATRGVSWSLRSGASSVMERGAFGDLEWSLQSRDVLPTLHPTIPYAADSSKETIAESGPNLKHSLKLTLSTNGGLTDSKFSPTRGVDLSLSGEVAGPPGDVGFAKAQASGSLHLPLLGPLSAHFLTSSGLVRPLTFGGYCLPVTLASDRFHIGGPMSLRGFKPSGVGPRSKVGPGSDGGDSLGGECFHTSTAMVSATLGGRGGMMGARVFGFGSGGLCCNWSDLTSVGDGLGRTRFSVGLGLAAPTPVGRLEATYSKVLRRGKEDITQPVQFGVSVNFG